MEVVAAIAVTALVLLAPFVLMWVFNGPDRADSAGRRISTRWRARPRPRR